MHFYGMVYYASPIWLYEQTTAKQWKLLNSMHYRALRTSSKDQYNIQKDVFFNLLKWALQIFIPYRHTVLGCNHLLFFSNAGSKVA